MVGISRVNRAVCAATCEMRQCQRISCRIAVVTSSKDGRATVWDDGDLDDECFDDDDNDDDDAVLCRLPSTASAAPSMRLSGMTRINRVQPCDLPYPYGTMCVTWCKSITSSIEFTSGSSSILSITFLWIQLNAHSPNIPGGDKTATRGLVTPSGMNSWHFSRYFGRQDLMDFQKSFSPLRRSAVTLSRGGMARN